MAAAAQAHPRGLQQTGRNSNMPGSLETSAIGQCPAATAGCRALLLDKASLSRAGSCNLHLSPQALGRASLLEVSAKGQCPAAMPDCRASLLDNGSTSGPARETVETADRDLGGVLRLQQETMQQQELDLEDMERQVNSTKASCAAWQRSTAIVLC